MDHGIGWRTLARYLAGESSPDEVARVERWAREDPAHAEILESTRRAWDVLPEESAPDVDRAWRGLAGRLAPGMPARRGIPGWAWGLAAAAVLATVVAIPLVRARLAGPGGAASYATAAGQVLTLRLADGSVVRLAPETRVRVTVRPRREVWLRGTAFFAVARQQGRPFTVHTSGGDARVLGTRFELSTEAERVRLVVVEGRVALSGSDGANEVVAAGEVSEVETGHAPSPARVADVHKLTSWMEGVLIFQATPLSEAAREIERQYRVPVRLSEPALGERTVNAVFDHQALETVATTICRIADATCEVQDSVVWIRP